MGNAAKSHLKHLSKEAALKYSQELSLIGLMVQVEAILNSRPITPLSSDPNNLNAFTPRHFFGEPNHGLSQA